MSPNLIDTREIRSFRMRKRALELKNFFEKKDSCGIFVMTNTLQPKEHIDLRSFFLKNNLKIINFQKKINKFLFAESKWHNIQNLLAGNVILIRDKQEKPLEKNVLKSIATDDKFSFRFLYWNYNIYRNKKINNFISSSYNNKTDTNFLLLRFLTKSYVKPALFDQTFFKHYN